MKFRTIAFGAGGPIQNEKTSQKTLGGLKYDSTCEKQVYSLENCLLAKGQFLI